jgi:hypothetical protein
MSPLTYTRQSAIRTRDLETRKTPEPPAISSFAFILQGFKQNLARRARVTARPGSSRGTLKVDAKTISFQYVKVASALENRDNIHVRPPVWRWHRHRPGHQNRAGMSPDNTPRAGIGDDCHARDIQQQISRQGLNFCEYFALGPASSCG